MSLTSLQADSPDGVESPEFEARAEALSRLWLQQQAPFDSKLAQAQALLDEVSEPLPKSRLQALSQAYGAMCLSLTNNLAKSTHDYVGAVLEQLRVQPWWRALAVAEAAWGYVHCHNRSRVAHMLEPMLQLQSSARSAQRPAVERLCTDIATSAIACGLLQLDLALQITARARLLTQSVNIPCMSIQVEHTLAYVSLSVGDSELAIEKLQLVTRDNQQAGTRSPTSTYNLLLTLAVAECFADAQALLLEHPWVEDRANLDHIHEYAPLLAYIHAQLGHLQAATAWLAWPMPPGRARTATLGANMAWLTAGALLRLGRHEQARDHLLAFLASPDGMTGEGADFTPMNGTQIFRLLSQAYEAQGDLRKALDALKRSQSYCYTWVGDSVRLRLQMLHLAAQTLSGAPAASQLPVQAQRVQALRDAVQARAQGVPATALADPDAQRSAARQLRWLAHVTHEVRNPVAGVLMMTSLLKLSELDDQQRRYAELAHDSAQMVLALCNDLLDLAKIDAGRFELNNAAADVATLLQDCAALFAPQMALRGVTMTCNVAPDLPRRLVCDALRLRQVVLNLLGNAAKFTEQGSITLAARWLPGTQADEGTLQVMVQDTGRGIAPEVMQRLFREFVQGDADIARTHGGSGLGLALCRSLLNMMGGRIDAQSTPDQGSSFWFDLPLQRCETVANALAWPSDAAPVRRVSRRSPVRAAGG